MKRIGKNGIICMLAALVCFFTGCKSAPAGADADGALGKVTFSDGIPEGEFALYITTETGIDWANFSGILDTSLAIGSSAKVNGNSVMLYPSEMAANQPESAFGKNAVYTVILNTRVPLLGFKYIPGVVFKKGSATVAQKDMIDL